MTNPEPERIRGLNKLVQVTCELAAQHDLNEILATVTGGVCEALDCERASLFLYDPHRDELYTKVVTELEIEEIRTGLDQGITGWVARHHAPADIPNPSSDPRWNSSVDKQTGYVTRNILAAPVLSQQDERLLAVLEVLNKRGAGFDAHDRQLLQAFAAHAATALERAALQQEARRIRELELSIEMGRQIQLGFLPDDLPEIPGYEIAAWWQPAESVSGDYYDWLRLPDGRIGLVVADVSGHGVGPSMIMTSVRAMLHVLTRTMSAPDQILSLLSETIEPDLKHGRFITCLVLALDSQRHRADFANAGHGPALHFSRDSGEFHSLATTSLPLGFPPTQLNNASHNVVLNPGDLLILATDGVIEVRDEHGEMFGLARLKELVLAHRRLPAPQIVERLKAAITAFYPKPSPPDDMTLVVVERKYQQQE